jgi:DNA-directed RNA polymerase subunit N (RpoN/RPB10)
MRKVINPISKSKSKIVVGGTIYNNLIEQGYVEQNGTLVKELKIYDDETQEIVDEYEKQLQSDEDDNEESSETDSSREFDFEDEDDFDEFIDNNDDIIATKPKKGKPIYDEDEDIEYDINYQPYYEPFNASTMPVFSRPTQKQTYLEILPPVRCHTCGKPVGTLYKTYEQMQKEGYTNEEIFEELEIKRYCCRVALEHPQKISSLDVNPNALYDLPSSKNIFTQPAAKSVRTTKLSKNKYLSSEPLTTKLSKNKYLSNAPVVTTGSSSYITRNYERNVPVTEEYNVKTIKSLPTRPLAGSKYSVSYIGI